MNRLELIIDALSELMYSNSTAVAANKYLAAINAANELKALKPVAYIDKKGLVFNNATHPQLYTPLYALEAELAKPEQGHISNSDLYSISGRLALELECLLLDTKDISIVSKWWDSAHEALDQWRKFHSRTCAALYIKLEQDNE